MSLIFLRLYSSVLLQWSQRKKCNTRRITSLIAWFHFVFQQKNHSRTENQEQIREGRGEILEVKFYMRNTHFNFSIFVYALYLEIYFHITLMQNYLCYSDQLVTDKTEFFAHERWFFLMMPHMKERLIICLKFDMIITKVSFPSVYINFIERNYN